MKVEQKYRQWISANFKKAFGEELIPFTQNGNNIPLCIGKQVKFNDEEFSDEQTRQEAYEKVLETYKQVQDQGDGIKSFTGILLYLMLDYYSIFLIDEPESFLHPPQANIMGRIIGETLSDNQQAFISTHTLPDLCCKQVPFRLCCYELPVSTSVLPMRNKHPLFLKEQADAAFCGL